MAENKTTHWLLEVPGWLAELNQAQRGRVFGEVESRARWVIELSRENISRGGGPFAAGVFERSSGVLIGAGVNLVEPQRCSTAHAEVVAIMLANQRLGRYDLGAEYQLVSSCEPCAMCMGAVVWSGVKSLVCCAADGDARAVGFDEGDKPERWAEKLRGRGIEVVQDILRAEARGVLEDYLKGGGRIY